MADWFSGPQLSLTPTFTLDWTSRSLLTSPLVLLLQPLENTEISVLPVLPVCSILPGLLLLLLASLWPSPRATSVPVFNNHITQMFFVPLYNPSLPLVWIVPLYPHAVALWLWLTGLFPACMCQPLYITLSTVMFKSLAASRPAVQTHRHSSSVAASHFLLHLPFSAAPRFKLSSAGYSFRY